MSPEFADLKSESGTVVNYLQGIVQQVNCFQNGDDGTAGIQVTHFTVFLEIKLVWGTVARIGRYRFGRHSPISKKS